MNSFLDAVNRGFVRPRVDLVNKAIVEPAKRVIASKKRKTEDAAFMDSLEEEEEEAAGLSAGLDAAQGSPRTPDKPDQPYMADMGDGDYDGGMSGDDLNMLAELNAAQGVLPPKAAPDMVDMGDGDYVGGVSGADFAVSTEGQDDEIPEFDMSDLTGVVAQEDAGESPGDDLNARQFPGPQFDKSALWDATSGARPAGIPEETLAALFAKTHGGAFDPKSKMDRGKMNVIRDMIAEDESLLGLSPTKFAMKVYGRK